MSTRNRLLFFLTAWLIVLMPVLFWWNTWFGRQLSDQQLAEYLQDEKHPRHIQHALVSRCYPPGFKSCGRGTQHRCLGDGAGHIRRWLA